MSLRISAAKLIGERMVEAIIENFERQRNKGGSRFKDLSPAYKKRKQREHGFVYPILKATSDLMGGVKAFYRRTKS